MLEKIYIIPHIWTRKLQEAILFSWPQENTYPYTPQCLAVSYQKISKDQPPSYQDEKGWEMVFRCMQPLWVATPACRNGSTSKCTTGITGYLPMLPPKGLPTARPTGNPPRTVTWEMTEGKSMEILENFWFFAIFPPKSLGRFGQIWTDWQDLADQFRFGFGLADWCRCLQEKKQRTHKFRLELPWVAYVTTKSPIGTARPSRVVAAEPVFVYCLPLPIRKENNLTNPCQILLPIHRFGMFWAFQCSLKDCRECIEAELLCHLWEEIPEIFLESHSWGVPIFHCPFHHSP